jgi:hypothetical protein
MKLLPKFLVAVMLVHLQCGGSCLVEAFGAPAHPAAANEEPSCHHQQDAPADDNQQPSHDANAPCSRGQLIEGKTYNFGKVVLQTAAILPAEAPSLGAVDFTFRVFVPAGIHLDLVSPVPISILRI